jgi:tetratricopeptide (TPR) repeat protein
MCLADDNLFFRPADFLIKLFSNKRLLMCRCILLNKIFRGNVMNKIFTILLVSGAISMQFACKPETASNSNNTNQSAVNSNAENANSSSVNVNVAKKEPEPVKEFTDANEALTEGKKLLDLDKNKEAVEVFKQAVKISPEMADAHFQLGLAHSLIESEKADNQGLEPEKKDANTNVNTGKKAKPVATPKVLESEKAFGEALKAYQKIIAKNPKDDIAQYNIGRCYFKLFKDKEAEAALRKATNMNPKSEDYKIELGAVMINLTKYKEAVGILKQVLKMNPNNSQAEAFLEKATAGEKRETYGVPKTGETKK